MKMYAALGAAGGERAGASVRLAADDGGVPATLANYQAAAGSDFDFAPAVKAVGALDAALANSMPEPQRSLLPIRRKLAASTAPSGCSLASSCR